jgi:hypothetical protein
MLLQVGRRPGIVALVDARMPGPTDAAWAIRLLRERFPSHRVVAFGDGLSEDEVHALLFLGADGYLAAPYEAGEVTSEIGRHLGLTLVPAPLVAAVPEAPDAPAVDAEPTDDAPEEPSEVVIPFLVDASELDVDLSSEPADPDPAMTQEPEPEPDTAPSAPPVPPAAPTAAEPEPPPAPVTRSKDPVATSNLERLVPRPVPSEPPADAPRRPPVDDD